MSGRAITERQRVAMQPAQPYVAPDDEPELFDDVGHTIRERGKEYGTTTGRPRRTGWFDAVAARYVARLNGITEIAFSTSVE